MSESEIPMCFNVDVLNDAKVETTRVFFEGTGAIAQGTAVCYNRDYGTATTLEASRDRRVELPNSTNHNWFAGVTMQAYPANPAGQWITIALPGSTVEVLTDGAITAIGQTAGFLTNDAGSNVSSTTIGKWSSTYCPGRGKGAVEFIQTAASAGLVLAVLLEGPNVGGVEVFTAGATAQVVSPFGISVLTNSADNTSTPWTLAAGTVAGQRKTIVYASIATANKIDFGATKLQSIAGGALSRYASVGTAGTVVYEWSGTFWTIKQGVVSTITIS